MKQRYINYAMIAALGTTLFTSLPAMEFDPALAVGRNALINQNLPAAKEAFASALEINPNSDKARVAFALCDLALVYTDPTVSSLMDRWGFTSEGRDLYQWMTYSTVTWDMIPEGANLDELTSLAESTLLPKLGETISHLGQVDEQDFELYLRPEYFDSAATGETFIADYTDVQLTRSFLLFFSSMVRLGIVADSMDLPISILRDVIYFRSSTVEDLLAAYPEFGKLRSSQQRLLAKQELKLAIEVYTSVAQALREPERIYANLFYLESWELDSEDSFRSTMLDLYAALDGPAVVTISDGYGYESFSETIDLRPLFDWGMDFRFLSPAFDGNLVIMNSMPDPTLQGLFPSFTHDDWSERFAYLNLLRIVPQPLSPSWPLLPESSWEASSFRPWIVIDDSLAQSASIADNYSSWIQTSVRGPAILRWDWKVSSEQGYDFLSFSTDRIIRQRISGETHQWQKEQRIGPGIHTIRWEYAKDYVQASGSDASWLGAVTLENKGFFATRAETGYELEVRGQSADGTILVGTLLTESSSNPMVDPGNGRLEKLRLPYGTRVDWFVTASDVSSDGSRIVGRVPGWTDNVLPVLWESSPEGFSPSELPTPEAYGMATSIGTTRISGRVWFAGRWTACIWELDPLSGDWFIDWGLLDSIPFLDGYSDESWLYDISDDGSLAVGWSNKYLYEDGSDTPSGVMSLPMYWRSSESSVHPMPLPAGYDRGQAYHISGNGNYVVGDLLPEEGSALKPCTGLWKKTGDNWSVQALPVPDELLALNNTPTPKISKDGSIVTTIGFRTSDEAFVAMIWQNAAGWSTAEEFLIQQGIDLAGRTVIDFNVSGNGAQFTGILSNPDGSESTFVFYKTNGWVFSNAYGWTYRYDLNNSYSLALGYIYETGGPWIYIYRNDWGWMCYVKQATGTSHYMYSPEWEWIYYDHSALGDFQSSAREWNWFNFHSPAP